MITEDMCTQAVRDLARAMYEAYIENSGGLSWDGKPCPTWDALGDKVRSHWCAAATLAAPFEPQPGYITAKVTAGHRMVRKGEEVAIVPMVDIAAMRAAWQAVPTNLVVARDIATWLQPLINTVTQILHPGAFASKQPKPEPEPS